MTDAPPPRIVLTIDRLRVAGDTPAEAAALAEALRGAVLAGLAAGPGPMTGGTLDRLRLVLPAAVAEGGPAARGQAAGAAIAAALSLPKGGR